MIKNSIKLLTVVFIALIAVTACKPRTEAQAPAKEPAADKMAEAPQSDGSKDLTIAFQVNTAKEDAENFFTFKGNIRYMAVDRDQADAATGASKHESTHVFQAYLYDVEGKNTMSGGLRGTFLFGVNPYSQITTDNFNASKASDGVITIQYTHRGTAYRIMSDSKGKLTFPDGTFEKRAIGYIKSGSPQVISKDFSEDGTAATVDWAKVWNSSTPDGKAVDASSDKKTGKIVKDTASPASLYYFDGALDVSLENDILKIEGALTAVPRR